MQALLSNGLTLYLGADDNLDAGEHDGVNGCTAPHDPTTGQPTGPCVADGSSGSANGPSDGGAVALYFYPFASPTPSLTNPVPVAGAGEGFCADGYCQDVTTHQQAVYHGGQNGRSRDVANYGGKQWDPYNCASGDQTGEGQGCANPSNPSGPQTMDQWRNAEAQNVNAEPGVQVYEDPDPQASPLDPLHESGLVGNQTPLYPIPSAYVGTCGVVAGGGPVAGPAVAGTPAPQNSANQVVVPTAC